MFHVYIVICRPRQSQILFLPSAVTCSMNEFPKILKELRLEKELTQLQLAIKLGFKSDAIINRWEKGTRRPDIDNLRLLSKFFGVTIDDLIGNE